MTTTCLSMKSFPFCLPEIARALPHAFSKGTANSSTVLKACANVSTVLCCVKVCYASISVSEKRSSYSFFMNVHSLLSSRVAINAQRRQRYLDTEEFGRSPTKVLYVEPPHRDFEAAVLSRKTVFSLRYLHRNGLSFIWYRFSTNFRKQETF